MALERFGSSIYDAVRKIARHPDAVLILGETGTGKELIAAGIHWGISRFEPRATYPVSAPIEVTIF